MVVMIVCFKVTSDKNECGSDDNDYFSDYCNLSYGNNECVMIIMILVVMTLVMMIMMMVVTMMMTV